MRAIKCRERRPLLCTCLLVLGVPEDKDDVKSAKQRGGQGGVDGDAVRCVVLPFRVCGRDDLHSPTAFEFTAHLRVS